jgi:uncharacterized cofD-like protein
VAQHRLAGTGTLRGHAVGNLILTALVNVVGDPVRALDLAGQLLRAAGRVLPVATEPLEIVADVVGLDPDDPATPVEVRGQVAVATTSGRVVSVRIEPAEPAVCPEAVQAVHEADWAVLGPGSWFTSVIPHLLVPQLRDALVATEARLIVVLNLGEQPGETYGFGPADHLAVLAEHAPELSVHTVIADETSVGADLPDLQALAAAMGARVVVAVVALGDGTPRHDPRKLADAYAKVLAGAV